MLYIDGSWKADNIRGMGPPGSFLKIRVIHLACEVHSLIWTMSIIQRHGRFYFQFIRNFVDLVYIFSEYVDLLVFLNEFCEFKILVHDLFFF